jgi:hypothetical protein
LQLAHSEEPVVDEPIGITLMRAPAEDEVIPTSPDPWPSMVSTQLPGSARPIPITVKRPYRQEVRVSFPAEPADVEFAYDARFAYPDVARIGIALMPIPVYADQVLYARSTSGAAQEISVIIEPKAPGR